MWILTRRVFFFDKKIFHCYKKLFLNMHPKTLNMKKTTTLLTALFAGTLYTQAVTISLNNVGSEKFATSSGGTTSAPLTSGVGTGTATYTYTLSDLNIAGDATANDSITFELSVTAGGTATQVLNNIFDSTGARDFNGWGTTLNGAASPEDAVMDPGHSLSFAVTSSSVTMGDGGPSTITFDGFSALRHRNVNTPDDVGTITLADTSTLTLNGSGSTNTGDFQGFGTVTDSFTVLNDSTSTGNFRIMRLSMEFTAEPIPEPSSTALLGLGGLALILRRRK